MLPAGVYEVDEQASRTYANAVWLNMAGVSLDELSR